MKDFFLRDRETLKRVNMHGNAFREKKISKIMYNFS